MNEVAIDLPFNVALAWLPVYGGACRINIERMDAPGHFVCDPLHDMTAQCVVQILPLHIPGKCLGIVYDAIEGGGDAASTMQRMLRELPSYYRTRTKAYT